MKQIDARGMSCPQPVLMVKKALEENPDGITVYVDNTTAKGNIERFASNSGYKVESRRSDDDFVLTLVK